MLRFSLESRFGICAGIAAFAIIAAGAVVLQPDFGQSMPTQIIVGTYSIGGRGSKGSVTYTKIGNVPVGCSPTATGVVPWCKIASPGQEVSAKLATVSTLVGSRQFVVQAEVGGEVVYLASVDKLTSSWYRGSVYDGLYWSLVFGFLGQCVALVVMGVRGRAREDSSPTQA